MPDETVLVVDDSQENIRFLCQYVLEPRGYKTVVAHDGETGLNYALTGAIDLMIIDLKMPRLTGLEVLKILRSKGHDVPTILMTFYGSEETAIQAFRLGAKDYLVKPFTVAEAAEAVERALTEKRLRQEKERLEGGVVRINRQLAQRVRELDVLSSIGKSVAQLVDLETALNRVVEAASYITGAEEASLLLVDEASGELYLRAARGLGETFARGFRLKVDDSLAGQVVRTGKPIRIENVAADQGIKIKTGYLVKSLLNVPLKAGKRVIGVLCVDNQVSNRPFSENDEKLLAALADYAAISIVNAQLFQELRRSRDEIQKWNQELEKRVAERTDELQRMQTQLIRAERLASVGQLAAGVAHEINNPLGIILGFSQGMLEQMPPDSAFIEPLRIVEQEALRCKRIIQNLLDFSRQSRPVMALTHVVSVLDTTLDALGPQVASHHVEVVRAYDADIPEIWADAHQLRQVFTNIVLNAIQAMRDGGCLTVSAAAKGDEVVISFRDTGIGIPEENLGRIFDPFFTTKEVGEGTGLGLSVSFFIVKQHQGTIDVESQVGKGACFTIHLPLRPSSLDTNGAGAAPATGKASA